MNQKLRICVMGAPYFTLDGEPLAGFVSTKAQALLLYLALNPTPQTRPHLAHLLWSESTEADSKTSLRSVLNNLKKLAGPWLDISRQTVSIKASSNLIIDLDEARQAQSIKQLVPLLRGEFLASISLKDAEPFEHWLQQQRESIRLEMLALIAKVQADQTTGRSPVEPLDQLSVLNLKLRFDPWHEPTWVAKLRWLLLSGRESEAIREADQLMIRLEENQLPIPQTIIQLRQNGIARQQTPKLHNVPKNRAPFIGRDQLTAQITHMLSQPDNRLITLMGMGGSGKTRLAQTIGRLAPSLFLDGAAWVPLASASTEEQMWEAISTGLNLKPSTQLDTQQGIVDGLAGQEKLLILDNFEQIVALSPQVGQLLDQLPHLRILVTSRTALNLYDEAIVPVGGLAYPDTAADVQSEYGAVDLFIAMAQRSQPMFNPADQWAQIVRICQLVDGLPLAIELAVATLRHQPLDGVEQMIRHQLDQLKSGYHNIPDRQKSLTAVFEYSWVLLTPEEQQMLAKAAAFVDGFSQQAALAVCGGSLKILQGLIDQSLVQVAQTGEDRLELHEIVRQFALQKLSDSGQTPMARQAHLHYFTNTYALPFQSADYKLSAAELAQVTADHPNLRQAQSYALEIFAHEPLKRLSALMRYLNDMRGRYRQSIRFYEYAISQIQHHPQKEFQTLSALFMCYYGSMLERIGKLDEALVALDKGVDGLLKTEPPNDDLIGQLCHKGLTLYQLDRLADAKQTFLQAISLSADLPLTPFKALPYSRLAMIASAEGKYEEGLTYVKKGIELQEALGNARGRAIANFELGQILRMLGRYDEAEAIFAEMLAYVEQVGELWGKAMTLQRYGEVLWEQGNFAKATNLLKSSLEIVEEVNRAQGIAKISLSLGLVARSANDEEAAQRWLNKAHKVAAENHHQPVQAVAAAALGGSDYITEALSLLPSIQTPAAELQTLFYLLPSLYQAGWKKEAADIAQTIQGHPGSSAWLKTQTANICKQLNIPQSQRKTYTLPELYQQVTQIKLPASEPSITI